MTPKASHSITDDQKAFKQSFDTYYDAIRRFVYYKSGDADLADDLVQQSFMRLWEVRETIRPDTVKALLYKIATNLLLNHYKHQKVVYNFENKYTDEEQTAESADFEIQQDEFNKQLQNALAQIPEKSRITFLMNRVEGLSYAEIAERLQLSVKAIEKQMHQALSIVREQIKYKI